MKEDDIAKLVMCGQDVANPFRVIIKMADSTQCTAFRLTIEEARVVAKQLLRITDGERKTGSH